MTNDHSRATLGTNHADEQSSHADVDVPCGTRTSTAAPGGIVAVTMSLAILVGGRS